MNKISLLFAFLLISNIVFAQKKKKQAPAAKDIKAPNCIWIEKDDTSFWIDQTEVANIHWQEFLEDTKEKKTEMYDKVLPDTTVWQSHFSTKKYTYMNKHYLSDKGFRFFPVVGISYEQAQAFCKWRSRVVTENYNLGKKLKHLQNYHIEVNYRLPTAKEWELAAQGNTRDEYGFEIIGKKRAKKLQRFYSRGWTTKANTLKDKRDYSGMGGWINDSLDRVITEYIFAYFPNDFGLYNMIGNVAEMVQEKGIAKGGSWLDKLEDCKIKSHKTYEKPNAWLGFRCVCEVKIKKIEQL